MIKKSFQATSSVDMSRIYFLSLAVNVVVLTIANKISPSSIVFGTSTLTPTWALFLSMGTLSLLITLCVPIFDLIQEEIKRSLTSKEWMVGYFLINFVGLWAITRFAEQLGSGIAAWWIAAVVAVVLDALQGAAIMHFVGKNNE